MTDIRHQLHNSLDCYFNIVLGAAFDNDAILQLSQKHRDGQVWTLIFLQLAQLSVVLFALG